MSKKNNIQASTLVEILVLMIVSGIVFMALFDGWELFQRVIRQTCEKITRSSTIYQIYDMLLSQVTQSDSILTTGKQERLRFYLPQQKTMELQKEDSLLILYFDQHCDTLFREVVKLSTSQNPTNKRHIEAITLELKQSDTSTYALLFEKTNVDQQHALTSLIEHEQPYSYEEF